MIPLLFPFPLLVKTASTFLLMVRILGNNPLHGVSWCFRRRNMNSFFTEHSGILFWVLESLQVKSLSIPTVERRWRCCGQCHGHYSIARVHVSICGLTLSPRFVMCCGNQQHPVLSVNSCLQWPALCESTPSHRGTMSKHMMIILGTKWLTHSRSGLPKVISVIFRLLCSRLCRLVLELPGVVPCGGSEGSGSVPQV